MYTSKWSGGLVGLMDDPVLCCVHLLTVYVLCVFPLDVGIFCVFYLL